MHKYNVTRDEAKAVLSSYESEDTTKELLEVGWKMVAECLDRIHWLDSKAGSFVAYGSAILALFASTFQIWKGALTGVGLWALFFAGAMALIAAATAMVCLNLQTFLWISEKDWLNKECINDPEQLKRYHLLVMHTVMRSHNEASDTKTKWIANAQRAFFAMGILLLIALGDATWKAAVAQPSASPSTTSTIGPSTTTHP